MSILSKAMYGLRELTIKYNGIFHRNIYFLNPKIYTEVPNPPTNQNEFRQEEQI